MKIFLVSFLIFAAPGALISLLGLFRWGFDWLFASVLALVSAAAIWLAALMAVQR